MYLLYINNHLASLGSIGSSGFGSLKREQIEINTFEIVKTGVQFFFNTSRQIMPLVEILT